MSKPRSRVIWDHVAAFVHGSGTSWPTFAQAVRELYEAFTPAELRVVEFSTHRDAYERMRLDAQTVRRFEHDIKYGLPCDLEEALVGALEHLEYRGFKELRAELALRYGLLAAEVPHDAPGCGMTRAGQLAKEFGEAMEALAPMLDNGRIDEEDAPHAKHALRKLNNLIAAGTAMSAEVVRILPDAPSLKVVKK